VVGKASLLWGEKDGICRAVLFYFLDRPGPEQWRINPGCPDGMEVYRRFVVFVVSG